MIPTDEQLLKEIRSISKTAPHLMMCANCIHYNMASGECEATRLCFQPFVRGCGGRYFVTNEELLLAKVKEDLTAQSNELQKIENLLALVITAASSASCYAVDLEGRIKKLRKAEIDSVRKSELRKDLDLVEDMEQALKRINTIASKMQNDLQEGLDKIEQQYRLYIERHINKLFTTDGVFDFQKSDGNLNNSMIACTVLGKFVEKCIGNKKNYDAFFKMLNSLKNDTPYGLGDKDWKHYELKEYD